MSGGSPKAARVVRTRIRTTGPYARRAPDEVIPPDQDLSQPPGVLGEPEKDVRLRIRQIHAWHGQQVAAEFCRRQVLALYFAGLSNDMMAEKLGVTVRTIERYRADIRKRNVQKARNVEADEMMGEILSYYEHQIHLSGQGFLTAKSADERAKAQMTGLKAQGDRVRFLKEWGVFDTHRYAPSTQENDNGAGKAKVAGLLEDLRDILSGSDPEDDIEFDE
jgi:hypothetical protein